MITRTGRNGVSTTVRWLKTTQHIQTQAQAKDAKKSTKLL